jgi:hypothetical protein
VSPIPDQQSDSIDKFDNSDENVNTNKGCEDLETAPNDPNGNNSTKLDFLFN